ncbi:UDP-N-acetylglucosamine 2-epimerase [Candidatus Pelagibacter sp.]|nr:UDP-N-acetylglucosamine 2-epimerase [Candidatus Pelagibacter sp.]
MKPSKINISVITGSRAEYGLLKKFLFLLKKDKKINLNLIVTGSHLSKSHGNTQTEIIKDGFRNFDKIYLSLKKGKNSEIINSMSKLLSSYDKIFFKRKPNLVFVLGDRYELLPAAISCLINRYNLAHIHGGEVTNGAYDDEIRHCISKIAQLHFVTHKTHKKRLIQMGENEKNIFNVGGLGVDAIQKVKIIKKNELEKKFKIKFLKKNILVTFHPVTKEQSNIKMQINSLLSALKKLKNTFIIFTGVNTDSNYSIIDNQINKFVKKSKNYKIIPSLGQKNYFSMLRYIDGVVGNSSSGILEAPSFKIATINIGSRQDGRIQSKSVINCSYKTKDIAKALDKIYNYKFKNILKKNINPYGKPGSSKKIYSVVKRYKKLNFEKKFVDLIFKEILK